MKEQVTYIYRLVTDFFKNGVTPYFNQVAVETISLAKRIQRIQKDFDFLTNFIFLLLVLILICITFKIFMFFRHKLFRFIENIVFSCKKGSWKSRINSTKAVVESNLSQTYKTLKYKPLFEFKDEPIKLEEILREVLA